jgi:hypothetical protein
MQREAPASNVKMAQDFAELCREQRGASLDDLNRTGSDMNNSQQQLKTRSAERHCVDPETLRNVGMLIQWESSQKTTSGQKS